MSKYLFECVDCKKHFVPDEVEYLCPDCSAGQKEMSPLRGVLRCVYNYDKIAKHFSPEALRENADFSFSRYLDLLPFDSADSLPPLITSFTPLRRAGRLGFEIGLENVLIKDDTVLPTASFKDRASAVVVACASERDAGVVATASTGNAATALAGQSAAAGMVSVIFVPESAPKAKLAQIAVYGGNLIPVKGSYDEAFELSIRACKEFGWYNRNTAYNPFTIEGKKTAALEVWEQMEFSAPDWVVVPTGDGVILAGIEKGFADLKALGLIDREPRLALIQADGCRPLVDAFERGGDIVSVKSPSTLADSISVGVPRAGVWALDAIRRKAGAAAAVSDDEILSAMALLGRTTGVFAEPAAAAAVAGAKKLAERKVIAREESVVILITGSGLKDVPAALRSVSFPKSIDPDLASLKKHMPRT